MSGREPRWVMIGWMWVCTGLAVALSTVSPRTGLLLLAGGGIPTYCLIRSFSQLDRSLAWVNIVFGYALFVAFSLWALDGGADTATFAGAGIR